MSQFKEIVEIQQLTLVFKKNEDLANLVCGETQDLL